MRFAIGSLNASETIALPLKAGAFVIDKSPPLGADAIAERVKKIERIEVAILRKPHGAGDIHLHIRIKLAHAGGIAHLRLHTHLPGHRGDLCLILQPGLSTAQHHQAARGEVELQFIGQLQK